MARKKLRAAHDALMKADKAALDATAPYEKTKLVKLLAWLSEIGDQPQLLTLSGGLFAVGLARRDRRMAHAGARMIAAHLLATAAKNFVKHRVDRTRPRSVNGKGGHKPGPQPGQGEDQLPLRP